MMRTVLFYLLMVGVCLATALPANLLDARYSRIALANSSAIAIGPGSRDFKKQDVPKKIPAVVKRDTVPNLAPLINQLMRRRELINSAAQLMPWVYSTGTEIIVADFEDAVASLDLADEYLQEAMQNLLIRHNDSFNTDPALVEATSAIDEAEYTILFLRELAISEL